jgi:putative nucleotidyltransferase with HDIG domain
MTIAPRDQLAVEFVRRLGATLRSTQLYSASHPIIARNLESLSTAVQLLHGLGPTMVMGLVGDEIIVNEVPLPKGENYTGLARRLKQIGVERVTIERGVTADEMTAFVAAVTSLETPADGEPAAFPTLAHIRVGRVSVEEKAASSAGDMATFKRLYGDAVSAAESIWESAQTESMPDVKVARAMIDGLAQAVSQNRTALLALTTLKNYDNYTFTHMVNVSLLTMGQARGLGIDGLMLREFGLAALMHDIGKVRTPLEILNKPDKLSPGEFDVMRRHTVDGAEILRATPDIPTLAPVVAFEHHLRIDGSGYPTGVARSALNLGTMLCSIADVYDAMRSQRQYQQSFPSDRILAVLKRDDGQQFDRHLVRRFVQLIGIYPPGNMVKLNTGEIAVVTKIYAPDPHRPKVKIVIDRAGVLVEKPYTLNLWEDDPLKGDRMNIVAPVDPADLFGIDPLSLL